ncbi:MAG: hypothetical protein ACQZ2J_24605 [Pseudomonas piscis]|uniref:hypothetical protein n=1 Tax=Pseudomonas piscis TaxID=2614538 RepID=UPI003D2DE1CF
MKGLQERWSDGQLIGLDIIYRQPGVIEPIAIGSVENTELPHTYGRAYSLSREAKTTPGELLAEDDDVWAQVQVNHKLSLSNGQVVLCGEGEMGNEGFIARTDASNHLEWFLFSTTANPFVAIKQEGDLVYVQSTHNFCVVLNLLNDDVLIVNESVFQVAR